MVRPCVSAYDGMTARGAAILRGETTIPMDDHVRVKTSGSREAIGEAVAGLERAM
jgi:hypothetical protein